jgi:hypothetical protein
LVFNDLHTAGGSDDDRVLPDEPFWPELTMRAGSRTKPMDIDAVADLFDFVCAYPDRLLQPMGQVFAYRRITGRKGIYRSPKQLVFVIGAIEVVYVAPMFAVDARRSQRQSRTRLRVTKHPPLPMANWPPRVL